MRGTMAIKNVCPRCKKSFSAPEDSLGKKVECPSCGHRSILRTAEEIQELEDVQAARQRKIEEDRERLALIEKMEARSRGARPYSEEYGISPESVRHFNPNAPSRFLRVRALSEILVLGAYLVVFLVLLGMGLTVYLKISGAIATVPVLLVCLVGWGIAGAVLYMTLKYLGELAFLLADVGDQQNDLVQLLLDIRDNTEPTE
jgi:DNA-directed RNA polymerase subunit RPC12/RpoP